MELAEQHEKNMTNHLPTVVREANLSQALQSSRTFSGGQLPL